MTAHAPRRRHEPSESSRPSRSDRHRQPESGFASDSPLLILKGFLARPREVGSIVPSSRFLERRIVRAADIASARTIVELGPGTGGTTRALLRQMRPDARLLAIEINPRFIRLLEERFDDPRLIVHRGSAAEIGAAMQEHALPPADVILSGIPFSTMPRTLGLEILASARAALAPGGRFVAYQLRDRVGTLGREVFGRPDVQFELLNVPPMRVFRWSKSDAAGA